MWTWFCFFNKLWGHMSIPILRIMQLNKGHPVVLFLKKISWTCRNFVSNLHAIVKNQKIIPIVTTKEHSAESPLTLSWAVQLTVVSPIAKVDPDAGTQLINGAIRKLLGVGADQVTNVDVWKISDGHISDGVPWTFSVKWILKLIIIIIITHFIAPSIKKNDRKALYKGKIQIRIIQP